MALVHTLGAYVMPTLMAVEGTGAVAAYTAVSVLGVLVVAMIAAVVLHLAVQTGVVGAERQVVLRRRFRVGFGVTFLLAAVTPYVALNFSAATLVPFVAGAGLVVAGWVWAAGRARASGSTTAT